MLPIAYIPLLSLIIAWLVTGQLTRTTRSQFLDHPNARSLHQRPVPRTGGWAIFGGLCVSGVLLALLLPASQARLIPIALGVIPLLAISTIDDWRGIAPSWRLLIHLAAATGLLIGGFAINMNPSNIPTVLQFFLLVVTWLGNVLFVVWMINLYNFMDGMDGFAGGMALIGFAALAWLGRMDLGFLIVQLSIAAASVGFLFYNFPPARIFLGDTGSTMLGFLAAASSLWGSAANLFPLWAALAIFSPFIVDATATLLQRMWRGERIWQAHRSHYYQRLVLLGWGHRRTVQAEYLLMLLCVAGTLWALELAPLGRGLLAITAIAVYLGIMLGIQRLEKQVAKQKP